MSFDPTAHLKGDHKPRKSGDGKRSLKMRRRIAQAAKRQRQARKRLAAEAEKTK